MVCSAVVVHDKCVTMEDVLGVITHGFICKTLPENGDSTAGLCCCSMEISLEMFELKDETLPSLLTFKVPLFC